MAVSGTLTWLESLARFGIRPGLERMEAMLAELGDPQRAFAAIHVVGTNGKSTTTRMIEALLLDAGLSVGSTVSPHVRSWSGRIQVNGRQVDFEQAVARVRPAAERAGATQFEAITAAAFAAFAEAGVTVAVIEAGLGGRWDATNVVGAGVVVLTNIALITPTCSVLPARRSPPRSSPSCGLAQWSWSASPSGPCRRGTPARWRSSSATARRRSTSR